MFSPSPAGTLILKCNAWGSFFTMSFNPMVVTLPVVLRSPIGMTVGFETTSKAREVLPAALHPADFTARPQFVKQEDNPEYYSLIKEFEKITGIGAILNTSFNLHGYPIILSPEDALYVFENSNIDAVLLNKYLVLKNNTS